MSFGDMVFLAFAVGVGITIAPVIIWATVAVIAAAVGVVLATIDGIVNALGGWRK